MNRKLTRLWYSIGAVVLFAIAARGAAGDADAAKKAQILASERWKNVLAEFDKWLSVQVVYTPEQVAQIKAKLAAQVQAMPAAELEQFLDQWDAKLKVLLGKDAAETRAWLGANLQVMADGYRKQFLQRLGVRDISAMSAAQIEDEMMKMREQRLGFEQQRAMFNYGRQQKVKIAQELESATSASMQSAGQGEAAQFGQFQSQYAPRQYDYAPRAPVVPFWW